MSLLFAFFLVVHGGVHIGYVCSRSWPFEPGDPWLVTGLGAAPEAVAAVGTALVLVTFFGFLLAALGAVGLLPARLWRPLVAVASAASAAALVLFVTPATVPGLVIDAVLLWAVFARNLSPTPLMGRRPRAGRPVTS
jgi:hypothetical protein